MSKRVTIGFALLSVILVSGYLLADWYRETPDRVTSTFVGRDSCIDCHQTQTALFTGSDHDLAMDLATDETVLADFNNQTIEHFGITSRVFRDGDRFMINTEGLDGTMQDFEVKYVFGVRPLQQFMVEIDRPADAKENEIGRVQVLRVSWDTNKKCWFYLSPPDVNEKLDPNDPLHWTGITQNWNASCATCHSTDLKKNFNPHSNQYHTTFSEIDVSCEACHGPGSYHVELANRKSLFWDRKHGYGLAKLKTESNRPQIETCAPCHSRRTIVAEGFQPGCNFDDYFATQLVMDPIYHADGQIRDEDYVYGSFIQSKMYHNGIRCTDCHDPHSTKVKFDNNTLCTSCHQHDAGKYDSPNHHHHEPGTPGASCVECHMPATTYMMVDSRRDHSLRVPRPDMSVSLGTPNACTQCHIDQKKLVDRKSSKPLTQYLDWIIAAEEGDEVVAAELKRVDQLMKEATEKWYPAGQSPDQTKYYEQIATGLSTQKEAVPALLKMSADLRVPALLRASALSGLGDDASPESLEVSFKALGDPDAKVVAAALLRLDSEISRIAQRHRYSPSQDAASKEMKPIVEAIAELFDHASARVRVEAARVFVSVDAQSRTSFTDPDQRDKFEKALAELKQSLYIENDRAAYHMMLGGLHEMLGDLERAKDDYRAAISVESNLAGPRSNLAHLLDVDAQRLEQQMRQTRPSGQMQASDLKKMRAEINRLGEQMMKIAGQAAKLRGEEHQLLGVDVERSQGLQNTHGLHYRYAMSCFIQQDRAGTERHLLEAYRQQPEMPIYLMGLAVYYVDVENGTEALKYINSLLKIDPRNSGYQSLFEKATELAKAADRNAVPQGDPSVPNSSKEQPPAAKQSPRESGNLNPDSAAKGN
ncbi:MAG: multiheme c-type cytochrome [Mariniblastus sp.]|nr:multiheme c-type cytochrome [Mariniblastus sp.]